MSQLDQIDSFSKFLNMEVYSHKGC